MGDAHTFTLLLTIILYPCHFIHLSASQERATARTELDKRMGDAHTFTLLLTIILYPCHFIHLPA